MSTTIERPAVAPVVPGARRPAAGRAVPLPVLLAVALLQAVSPLATDLYLPAFPALAGQLGTDSTGAQLTLTAFLAGTALGQLLLGPLSDRYGRRRPLLIGAGVAVVASVGAAFAPTLGLLVLARLLQGASCAAGMVIGRAVIADLSSGRAAAQAFSLMMSIAGIAPIAAPVLGGLLAGPLGWRGILGVVAALTVVVLVVVLAVVPETRVRLSAAPAGSARAGLGSRRFIGHALVCGFGFAAIMAYVASSPFLYERVLGVTPARFGLLFAVNAVVLVGSTFVSSRLVRRREPGQVLRWGLSIIAVAVAVFATVALLPLPAVATAVALPLLLSGFGLTMGNAAAAAITAVPHASGTASAVLGAGQFTLGGVSSAVVGLDSAHPARSLAIVLLICVAVMLGGLRFARRSVRV